MGGLPKALKGELSATTSTGIATAEIQPVDLQVMSIDWINNLERAAIECDADAIRELITQIPASEGNLVNALGDLVDRFCFGEILELTAAI